jgi:hypothetical protein
VHKADRIYTSIQDGIERPEYLADYLILKIGVVMFFHDMELPPIDALKTALRSKPFLRFLVGGKMFHILYKIKTPSFGLGAQTIPLKDLPQEDVFFT